MIRSSVFVFAVLGSLGALAAIQPMKIQVLGFPEAPVSGTFQRNLQGEPHNFSPVSGAEHMARLVYEYTNEGLLTLNMETFEFEPGLAENYEVSKDFLTYTFFLNKKAKFSDGTNVTPEDVKFSIEAVKNPAYMAGQRIPFYEDIDKIEKVDEHTVRFKMKRKYFKSLESIATIGYTPIVPKHAYEDPKKNWGGQAPIVGSGPYKVEAYNRGKNILLVRDKNWWGQNEPNMKSLGKFEKINFRFIKERDLELEMVKKGQIDYMWDLSSEMFEKKAIGEPFGTKVQRVEALNEIPKTWGFVGWNFKNPIFKDRDTRVALAKLMNRKLMLEKFAYGRSVEAVGPIYFASEYSPPNAKPFSFDFEGAQALLKKAGWEDKNKDGVLEKKIGGKTVEFRFALLLPTREAERYFTIYKEDLKRAGVDMEIKLVEWNTFAKLLDEKKFDAVTLAWAGGTPEEDLKQIWHTDSARESGSNYISYSNKKVDKLIDQARQEMNRIKRRDLWREAARLIAEDAPYAFMFNPKYTLFLLNKRIAFDKPTYRYDFSHGYWKLAAPQ